VNLTIQSVRLGGLTDATAETDYETGLTLEGIGQADAVVHLEGEDDGLTLELGQMPEGATEAARILRELADQLDEEAERYELLPVQWDGFAFDDRGWSVSLEGTTVDVPKGLTEEGAVVALELACRETGVFPALWIDRYAGSSSSMPVALTAEAIREAAAAVLDGEGLDAPTCAHCDETVVRRDGTWVHDDSGWYGHAPTYPVACDETTDEAPTVAEPALPFDRADVLAILEGPTAIGA
jgi:hypothetical protein